MPRWLQAVIFSAALAMAALSQAEAQTYPNKPITIVIGYTPGAVSDLAARTIAEGLHQAWGQPVIVDNRPGSGGNIGAAFVARAPADGYTLMIGTDAQMASNLHLYKHVGFDPVRDFAPVALAGANIICLAVNADLPIKTVADLIAYAKKNPGKLTYASPGTGTSAHLAGELLKTEAGIDMIHAPYKGSGPAQTDLVAGRVDLMMDVYHSAKPQVEAGKLKVIALAAPKRVPGLSQFPVIAETVPRRRLSGIARGNQALGGAERILAQYLKPDPRVIDDIGSEPSCTGRWRSRRVPKVLRVFLMTLLSTSPMPVTSTAISARRRAFSGL